MLASTWLISACSGSALRAALRYLLMHLFGGALLLAGIVWLSHESGSLVVGRLPLSGAGWLILLGFAVNAAIPPLHTWIADAYPEATPAGSVFLSAFTTKAAVYLARQISPAPKYCSLPAPWRSMALSLRRWRTTSGASFHIIS